LILNVNSDPTIEHNNALNWWRRVLLRLVGEDGLPYPWIPILQLSPRHRLKIVRHLCELNAHDRYLRFGYAATNEHIGRYVEGLNFLRDEVYGVFNRRLELVAMAHLAFSIDPQWSTCAEFGVSVLSQCRGKGLGAKLFDHAVLHARNEGVRMLFIHALSENSAMLRIAKNAGARVERDGSESEAYLELPAANLDSQVTQILNEQMSEMDYQVKAKAKHFRDILAVLQEIRQGVREARHQSKP
jgi:GNAT superfamily N-acetyltransferase